MKILGLSRNIKVQKYLTSVYGLEVFEFAGLPAFRKDEEFFLGGFKGFYVVMVDEDKAAGELVILDFFAKYKKAYCNFSVSNPDAKGALVHYLLRLKRDTSLDARFDLYNKKTRNQVRKSYNNNLRIEVGAVPVGFHDLYTANIERLKSIAKAAPHFDRIEKFFEDSIVCFSAFDGDILVGCNYAVVSENYMLLLFNVSNSKYWSLNLNDRLYDELIAWAMQHDIEFVDFGAGVRRDESHNHFKEGFGAIQRTIIDKKQTSFLLNLSLFISQKIRNLRLRIFKIIK